MRNASVIAGWGSWRCAGGQAASLNQRVDNSEPCDLKGLLDLLGHVDDARLRAEGLVQTVTDLAL